MYEELLSVIRHQGNAHQNIRRLKQKNKNTHWQRCRETGFLILACENVKCSHFGKTAQLWLFLKIVNLLPYDSILPFLGICSRELKSYVHKSTQALLRVPKVGKQPKCSTND